MMLLYKMVKEHVYQTDKLPELYAKHVTCRIRLITYILEDRTHVFFTIVYKTYRNTMGLYVHMYTNIHKTN